MTHQTTTQSDGVFEPFSIEDAPLETLKKGTVSRCATDRWATLVVAVIWAFPGRFWNRGNRPTRPITIISKKNIYSYWKGL